MIRTILEAIDGIETGEVGASGFLRGLSSEELTAADVAGVAQWPGARRTGAEYAIREVATGGVEGFGLFAPGGQMLGVVSYGLEPAGPRETWVTVQRLATSGMVPGTGREIMRRVAQVAADRGAGVMLLGRKEAHGFYRRIGVKREPGEAVRFRLSSVDARKFAQRGKL